MQLSNTKMKLILSKNIKHKDERENIIIDKEQDKDKECYLKIVLKMKTVTVAKSEKRFSSRMIHRRNPRKDKESTRRKK